MSKISGGTSIMGLSKKFAIIFAVASLPIMVMYQNCSKTQNFEMNDMTAAKLQGSSLDSSLIPSGVEVSVDIGAGSETNKYQVEQENNVLGTGSDGVLVPGVESVPAVALVPGVQSVPGSAGNPGATPQLADCSKYKESNNDNQAANYTSDSASGVQGKKVLSPEDFNGNRHIKSISNTGGWIILCNLEVDEYSDSKGRLDLVNSHVSNFVNFKADLKYNSGP